MSMTDAEKKEVEELKAKEAAERTAEIALMRGDNLKQEGPAEKEPIAAEPEKKEVVEPVKEDIKPEVTIESLQKEIETLRADKETLLGHKGKLEVDLYKLREKNRELVALQPKETETKEDETSIDPEVVAIIKREAIKGAQELVAPIAQKMRVDVFKTDEERVISKYGKEKYDFAYKTFEPFILSESPQYDEDLHQAWLRSDKPAEFILKQGIAKGFDEFQSMNSKSVEAQIEQARKETAEKIRKETLEELRKSAGKVIPSLSAMAGGIPKPEAKSEFTSEVEALRRI